MSDPGPSRVYGSLLRLYPRPFREYYGTDMLQLFADQLGDEGRSRVWVRAIVDLALTVPTRHMEAHMTRRTNDSAATALYTALAVSGVAMAAVGGTEPAMLATGLVFALAAGGLALVSARRDAAPADPTAWWKVLSAGVVLFAGVVITTTITGELSSGWWFPMMAVLFSSIVVTIFGLILGIRRFATRGAAGSAVT
ncbi:MAG TPA: hypothetical protein VM030_09365 [Acidimicrobiales bacterium]|nr:hypothetical protein [Acidimicrobiales bacterium]